jgi:hypothetical protein
MVLSMDTLGESQTANSIFICPRQPVHDKISKFCGIGWTRYDLDVNHVSGSLSAFPQVFKCAGREDRKDG